MKLSSEYGTRHMLSNSMLKEHEIKIGNMNKVRSYYVCIIYINKALSQNGFFAIAGQTAEPNKTKS